MSDRRRGRDDVDDSTGGGPQEDEHARLGASRQQDRALAEVEHGAGAMAREDVEL
ncbi:MAG: hypothetical protein HY329_06020, partial [Chloroflexi bacterium]|nr:hypothetical protein [Chloroflexota bacterium]